MISIQCLARKSGKLIVCISVAINCSQIFSFLAFENKLRDILKIDLKFLILKMFMTFTRSKEMVQCFCWKNIVENLLKF